MSRRHRPVVFTDGSAPSWAAAKPAALACPSAASDERLFARIALRHAFSITDQFVARHGHAVAPAGSGVVALLERWAASAGSADLAFEPAFGDAFRCVASPAVAASRARVTAASLALHLSSGGVGGDWDLSFDAPVRLRCGPLLLPAADRISVHSDRNLVTVTMRAAYGHRVCTLPLSGDAARTSVAAPYATRLPRLSASGASIRFLTRSALESSDLVPDGPHVNIALESIDPDQIDFVKAALESLEAYAPSYHRWVCRVARDVVLLDGTESAIDAGSIEAYLGLVQLAASANSIRLAALLVRESAHQHFNLVGTLGPVVTEAADDTRARRYHALANVLLFYRECLANGTAVGNVANVLRDHVVRMGPGLAELGSTLQEDPSLTEVGRELIRTLAERVALDGGSA
jgi:HEXXH motif-containing protein